MCSSCVLGVEAELFIIVCAHVFLFKPFFSGGYENFHSQYPELCTEVKTIDQAETETEKRVNILSEKLSHRKPDYDQVWKHPLLNFLGHTGHTSTDSCIFNLIQKRNKTKKHIQALRDLYLASVHQYIFSTNGIL